MSAETKEQEADDANRVSIPEEAPYEIELPFLTLAEAGIEQGSEVDLSAAVIDKEFTLILDANPAKENLMKPIRTGRYSDTKARVTLPKKLVEAAALSGTTLTLTPADQAIHATIHRDPMVDIPIEIEDIQDTMISRYSGSSYVLVLDPDIVNNTPIGDTIWFSLDYYGKNTLCIIDTEEEEAPPGAIEVTSNPQDRAPEGGLRIQVPIRVAKALNISGREMQWGRTGTRFIGLFK